ncbi:MAG: hypothetical protein XD78_0340 [Desulfotomaculum sp. 46_296]|nr:MAG: hypothetical protein XD78_0340 [Desulfotomaculum sp. 46_296]KUK84868.1 MAG: hypothetical protein XE00_0492 [Desulfofundulus kuznetsovii]HAU31637.1 hypothetical protein [Desulfotomaculum sp.]
MLPVVVLLISLWFIWVLWILRSLCVSRTDNQEQACLIVILGDQEHSAEGFLRKLAFLRNKFWPLFEVIILDSCQNSRTTRIISLLAAQNGFKVTGAGERDIIESSKVLGKSLCYDARPLKDGELIKAPLFSLISSNQLIIEVKGDGR